MTSDRDALATVRERCRRCYEVHAWDELCKPPSPQKKSLPSEHFTTYGDWWRLEDDQ